MQFPVCHHSMLSVQERERESVTYGISPRSEETNLAATDVKLKPVKS